VPHWRVESGSGARNRGLALGGRSGVGRSVLGSVRFGSGVGGRVVGGSGAVGLGESAESSRGSGSSPVPVSLCRAFPARHGTVHSHLTLNPLSGIAHRIEDPPSESTRRCWGGIVPGIAENVGRARADRRAGRS